jgi:hypothetical protein
MRSEVDTVVVRDTADRVAALLTAANDVRDAGKVADLTASASADDAEPTVDVTLAQA